MTTDRQVIDLLASQLGVRRAFVERTAVFLREAGELGKGEDVEPRDARRSSSR
ncbi:MAG: hypothetical protein HY521_06925 [Proteobacteria bacterium]|nr:hypothetical protein [Pseudomonadota bacterium]